MADAKQISDLKAFKDACFSEFLAEHPDICERWLQHFGRRIEEVRRGILDERDFTGQWQVWQSPSTSE